MEFVKTEVVIPDLIRSLDSVRAFACGEAEFYKGSEFMELHTINIKYLAELSSEGHSSYFKEKITEYPSISEGEIDNYLENKNGRGSRFHHTYSGKASFWAAIIFFMVDLFRSGRNFSDNTDTASKFIEIGSINENIIYVLRNPGMEELIRSAKKSRDTQLE